MAICNHQAGSPLQVWPVVRSVDLQAQKRVVKHDTEYLYRDQVSLNSTKLEESKGCFMHISLVRAAQDAEIAKKVQEEELKKRASEEEMRKR